jgi:hypothetical protein
MASPPKRSAEDPAEISESANELVIQDPLLAIGWNNLKSNSPDPGTPVMKT